MGFPFPLICVRHVCDGSGMNCFSSAERIYLSNGALQAAVCQSNIYVLMYVKNGGFS